MVALAFAFEGVSAMLNGAAWPVYTGALVGAVVFFLAGIAWPKLRSSLNIKTIAKNPAVFWITTILLVWIPVWYGTYDWRLITDVPEFDDPQNTLVYSWGAHGDICNVFVNGDRFWRYRHKYKLVAGCFVYDGLGSILDASDLQVGNLYDISSGTMLVAVKPSPSFVDNVFRQKLTGVDSVLLMVPNGVEVSQLATLRRARELGVHIVFFGGYR